MRILCWNVNGWKKIRTYQPWFRLDTWSAILEHLDADVICLQETKLTRKQALDERSMCLPGPAWESFWDFHPLRGYSGTVIYVKKDTVGLPELAEVGITGRKFAIRSQADGSPSKDDVNGCGIGGHPRDCQDELDDDIFYSLDEEGRCTIVDYGFFVLFNLYCPVMGSEDRRDFRQAFYASVDERARNLMSQGRNVIIVGDINIARQPIDHCDHCRDDLRGEELATYYDGSPTRAWFEGFCQPRGPFHDVARECFPRRKGMFTCWNTLINARPSNYGTRIDYTLVSPGIRDWVKHGDIQADVMGSDHCPVFVDLYDERVIDGKVVKLRDLLSNANVPPALAASRWPEFNAKSLKTFFASASQSAATPSSGPAPKEREICQPPPRPSSLRSGNEPAALPQSPRDEQGMEHESAQRPKAVEPKSKAQGKGSKAKAKSSATDAASTKGGKQTKLGNFFAKSPTKELDPPPRQSEAREEDSAAGEDAGVDVSSRPANTAKRKRETEEEGPSVNESVSAKAKSSRPDSDAPASDGEDRPGEDEEVDWEYLASLPDPDAPSSSQGTASSSSTPAAASAWSALFRPPPAPLCTTHREPAKSFVVNKRDKGANFGRKFWLCARPVGPGWEKGWHERGHGGEDLEYRCGFFMWNSTWEGELKRKGKGRDFG